jgi:dihydroxyacid dehydratase/phosphogluconate dehydratase
MYTANTMASAIEALGCRCLTAPRRKRSAREARRLPARRRRRVEL